METVKSGAGWGEARVAGPLRKEIKYIGIFLLACAYAHTFGGIPKKLLVATEKGNSVVGDGRIVIIQFYL